MTTASKIDSYLVPDELADILPLCETDRLLLKDVHVLIIFHLSSLFFAHLTFFTAERSVSEGNQGLGAA